MSTHYVARLREILEMVRRLGGSEQSPAIDRAIAELEQELQQAATELTIQACRQAMHERRTSGDRRQTNVPVAHERRTQPLRRESTPIETITSK